MTAYILEKLYLTGWRRNTEIYWRRCDAEDAGQRAIDRDNVRAVRILSAAVSHIPIAEIEAPPKPQRKRTGAISV